MACRGHCCWKPRSPLAKAPQSVGCEAWRQVAQPICCGRRLRAHWRPKPGSRARSTTFCSTHIPQTAAPEGMNCRYGSSSRHHAPRRNSAVMRLPTDRFPNASGLRNARIPRRPRTEGSRGRFSTGSGRSSCASAIADLRPRACGASLHKEAGIVRPGRRRACHGRCAAIWQRWMAFPWPICPSGRPELTLTIGQNRTAASGKSGRRPSPAPRAPATPCPGRARSEATRAASGPRNRVSSSSGGRAQSQACPCPPT